MPRHKIQEHASAASSVVESLEKLFDPLEYTEEVVSGMMLDLQNNSIQQHHTAREFRTSSLPFCPILDFIREPQFEDYKKSHYTTTGTAIHETIQSWLSLSKISKSIMYGSWECTGCKTVKLNQMFPRKECDCDFKVSTTHFHRRYPKHWTYKEVEYNYHGLSGHIDLILVPRPDFAFVVDFKTTELAKKQKRYGYKQDKTSSPNYIAQIRTYSTILSLEHKLPIRSWCLVNTERGKPITSLKDFHMQVGLWGEKQTARWDKVLRSSITNNLLLQKLERAVNSNKRVTAKKALKKVIEHRPCRSQDDYDKYMKYKFYSGKCELCTTCFSASDSQVFKRVQLELGKKE